MLSFYVVRGTKPDYILSLSAVEKAFYYKSMELYYKELSEVIKVINNRIIG